MSKHFTKAILIFGLICGSFLSAHAQLGFNYDTFDLGLSLNTNKVYGDAEKVKTRGSVSVNLTYSPSPYTNFIFDIQAGALAGGDSLNTKSGREFRSNFTAFTFRGQLQAGELIDYSNSDFANALKNIYLSTGIGLASTRVKDISRYSQSVDGYYTPGKDRATQTFIPVRIGYELKIFDSYNTPSVKIDFAYQQNFVLGDDLDGFNAGVSKDVWTQFVIGVKFAIGGGTSYRKPISRY